MQVALRVVGGEDSRAVHPRAQLLEKISALGWPVLELKLVEVDALLPRSGIQPSVQAEP